MLLDHPPPLICTDSDTQLLLRVTVLVNTVKKDFMTVGRFVTSRGIKDAEILDGLNILFHFLRDNQLAREEDTFQCCRSLHVFTKWLAGDNPYPAYL